MFLAEEEPVLTWHTLSSVWSGSVLEAALTLHFPLGLVKAINTAVDLIVAHFGTSRDPGVKVSLVFLMLFYHHK